MNITRIRVSPVGWRCDIIGYALAVASCLILVPSCVRAQEYVVRDLYDESYVLRVEGEPIAALDGTDDTWVHTALPSRDADTETQNNIYTGVDEESQCKGQEYPYLKYSTCYGYIYCKHFSRNRHYKYLTLRITTTAIVRLMPGDFAYRNSHLEIMKIDGNDYLESIEPGAFDGMSAMRNLSIYNNLRLTHLHRDSFRGLVHLDVLFVIANSFVRFYDITVALHSQSVPILRKLKLGNMVVSNASRADFEPLTGVPLQILSMLTCHIEYLDPDILIPLAQLQIIRIGQNMITVDNLLAFVEKIAELQRPLDNLSVSNSGFRAVPIKFLEAIQNTSISHLTLSDNYFERIEKFPPMTKIKYLDLKGVSAVDIAEDAFAKLPRLETLILNKNQLFKVPSAVNLPTLYNLDISENIKDTFTAPVRSFSNMHNLRYLNMSRDSIRVLDNETFAGLRHLRALDLESSQIYTAYNGTFAGLRSLQFLKLKNNLFPGRFLHPEVYRGLVSLKVLILSKCSIKEITEEHNIFTEMPNLLYLLLDENNLETLGSFLFQHLTKLISLDISHNRIVNWEVRLFPANNNLQKLKASYNVFRRLSPAMVEDFSELKSLDVRNNAFACTCDEIGAHPDVITKEVSNLLSTRPPLCAYPDELSYTTILDYAANTTVRNYCENKLHPKDNTIIMFAVPMGLLTFFLCCAIIAVYIFRWHVRYWLFLLRVGLSGSESLQKSPFRSKKTYRYDAFVSYCNEDRNFVIRLVSMLENYDRPLKLCVYERDFQIGTVISESVLESVADSRRTLLVISDAYIKSQWCRWEVQVAENHRLFFEDEYGRCVNDTLVMVKLGDISQTKISPMLRYLMKTRIYLQWDPEPQKQRAFWRKLRKSLNPPRAVVIKRGIFK